MRVDDWHGSFAGVLGLILPPPEAAPDAPALLVLINREPQTIEFKLPPGHWQLHCETSAAEPFASSPRRNASAVSPRSIQILSQD